MIAFSPKPDLQATSTLPAKLPSVKEVREALKRFDAKRGGNALHPWRRKGAAK